MRQQLQVIRQIFNSLSANFDKSFLFKHDRWFDFLSVSFSPWIKNEVDEQPSFGVFAHFLRDLW
jgi:hypothetical protein